MKRSIVSLIFLCLLLLRAAQVSRSQEALVPIAVIEHTAPATALIQHPTTGQVGIYYADGTAHLQADPAAYTALAFAPDGRLATANGTQVQVDGVERWTASATVRFLTFDPTGTRLAIAAEDGSLQILSVDDGAPLGLLTGYSGTPQTVLFDPTGLRLASTNPALQQVRLWEADHPSPQMVLPGAAPLAFSPDGTLLAMTEHDEIVVRPVASLRVEDEILARLSGHYAPVTALAFYENTLASGSADGTISLWELPTGTEIRILTGHTRPVQQLAFTPDGSTLASAGADGQVILWDRATGAILAQLSGTGAPLLTLAYNGTQLVAGDSTGQVILWGTGTAVEVPAVILPTITAAEALEPLNGVIGYARASLTAGAHPDHPVGCTVQEDEKLLVLGQSSEGALLAYTESCEGTVWLKADPRLIELENEASALPWLDPGQATPLLRLPDTESICASAAGQGSLGAGPHRAYPPQGLPTYAQATITTGADVIICHEYTRVAIEHCQRLDSRLYAYIFSRFRLDDRIRLVDAATGEILAERRFRGQAPAACPNRVARGEAVGQPSAERVWIPWVLSELGYGDQQVVRSVTLRTTPALERPNSEAPIITQLAPRTPFNVIGRAGTDWLLVLLPGLRPGWLFAGDVELASTLEVASLPDRASVSAAPIRSETEERLAQFASFRPLGRFNIPLDVATRSRNGYFVANVITYLENEPPLLTVWDVRGGQALWSVSIPERTVQQVVFSPDSQRLLVVTNAPYPAEEEVRFTFFEVATGTVISETGDVDVIDAPTIPGNMPQALYAEPQYTGSGEQLVVSYWRRAEEPRCAIWDVPTAALIWEIAYPCGALNPTGTSLAILEPYAELNSAYARLAIYDTASGALLGQSEQEVQDYRWLDADHLLIDPPYGDDPLIWNITADHVALIEMPQVIPDFTPQVLGDRLLYYVGSTGYLWEMATGALLNQTEAQGQVVSLAGQIIVLQEIHPATEEEDTTLRAINAETGDLLWELPWEERHLWVRGEFGFVYDGFRVDVIALATGETIGRIPFQGDDYYLTEDWNWIVQSDGYSQYVVWGLEDHLPLFADPPHARARAEITSYYEPNTQFEYGTVRAGEYLWLVRRTADNAWVQVESFYGEIVWLPTEQLDLLIEWEQLPVMGE